MISSGYKYSHNGDSESVNDTLERRASAKPLHVTHFAAMVGAEDWERIDNNLLPNQSETALFLSTYQDKRCCYASIGNVDYVFVSETVTCH